MVVLAHEPEQRRADRGPFKDHVQEFVRQCVDLAHPSRSSVPRARKCVPDAILHHDRSARNAAGYPRGMPVTDPVDARLLAALAESGKIAVHELAARVGIDPREAAYRLVALSGGGLPLLVGVECDPNGVRAALAGAWPAQPAPGQPPPNGPTEPRPDPRGPSGQRPASDQPSSSAEPAVPTGPPPQHAPDEPLAHTWGLPQSSSWAREDHQPGQ